MGRWALTRVWLIKKSSFVTENEIKASQLTRAKVQQQQKSIPKIILKVQELSSKSN
jgi:hypothetical protein